ncbi:MAG: N-acetyl-gamma-glutamyl-phosphate reductase [Planctomycetota bacterium]
MSTRQHEAVVLGATGYVGAEVLRLIAGHPNLKLGAAVARSAVGKAIGDDWPHLRGAYAGVQYQALDAVPLEGDGVLAVFSCLPHGAGATQLDEWLGALEGAGRSYRVVDLAADFRLPGPADWLSVYGEPHGAPGRYPQFACALPDLTPGQPSELMAHPGCFTTATTLGAAPLCEGGLIEPGLFVSAITGSTGSGREAKAGTHHPDRHGNLSAYNPLRHRHAPEMEMLLGRLGGVQPEVSFVPHSGPFARGIHATLHARLREPLDAAELRAMYREFYGASPFVAISEEPPKLKEVVGSNRCHIGIAARGHEVVVFSVIDNLIKGAAGGAVQWMNRLLDLPDTAGLEAPALAW